MMWKSLTLLGVLLVVVGLLGGVLSKFSMPLDIHIRGKGWEFYFPLGTCILLSIILTVILNLLVRR